MSELRDFCKKHEACDESVVRAKAEGVTTLSEAWEKLDRCDWMLWIVGKAGIMLPVRKARLFACDCAERVLPLFEKEYPTDKYPRKAMEAARLFADGKATEEELSIAGKQAWPSIVVAWHNSGSSDAKYYAFFASESAGIATVLGTKGNINAPVYTAWYASIAASLNIETKWQADRLRYYFPKWEELQKKEG